MKVFFKVAELKNIGFAELQIKNCFVWTSDFLLEGLQNPIFLHAAPLENTSTGMQQNIFGTPSININDSFLKRNLAHGLILKVL